jgi:16S rRNA processing protein RimM
VPRAELPQRDDKDFYRTDLIGCEVVNLAGRYLGKVQHFVETPAQVLMVVRGGAAESSGAKESPGTREYWVPAVPLHLRRVDLTARRVVVDWDDAAG